MIGRKQQDDPFHLPPSAEMGDIADIAAMFGPGCGFQPGIIAKRAHQRLRIVEGGTVGNVELGVNRRFPLLIPTYQGPCQMPCDGHRHGIPPHTMFNAPFTKSCIGTNVPYQDRLVSRPVRWQRARMSQSPSPRAPRATGSILALTIIAGTAIGAVYGEPSAGLLAGVAIGVVISLAFWWNDRRP